MTIDERKYYVYILTNQQNGTLYTGMTSDLARRVHQHKSRAVKGFTQTYDTTRLVWYEVHEDVATAYRREYLIKRWKRAFKIQLIERDNPLWRELSLM
jgi:putative endonuclease